jgi:uncharacterized damage-inducible protein DinB
MKEQITPVQTLGKQFALHSRLFNNVLDSVEDAQGSERLNDQVNHIQWIAGHLTNSRYRLASMLGIQSIFPYREVYMDLTQPPPFNRPIDSSIPYPPLRELTKSWNDLAGAFVTLVSGLDTEQLAGEMPTAVPTGKTLLDFISFISSHESYHIGQMSIIRKYIGLPAMSYK